MRRRFHKSLTFLLALLLVVSSWVPLSGRAEAQMRCAGASPRSAPCARTDVSAAGMTQGQVYKALMSCCRSMHGGCTVRRGCPMRHASQGMATADQSSLSNNRCVVSVRVSVSVPASLAAPRARWLLTASPALAPPIDAPTVVPDPHQTVRIASWTYTPVLSPHSAPALHGLRAPPAA